LGPERFTEWKAALINQAAGQVPNLFRQLEEEVRKGNVQPDPDRGALAHRQLTPGYDFLKLVYTNMVQLRVVLTDLRRAELAAAKEAKYWHDTYTPPSRGVARGGAKDPTDDPAELYVLF
jgi:hypothetical protein